MLLTKHLPAKRSNHAEFDCFDNTRLEARLGGHHRNDPGSG